MGASAGVTLMVLEAVSAELTSNNDWVQAYGRQDKDCLSGTDTCVTVCALNQVAEATVARTSELRASQKRSDA